MKKPVVRKTRKLLKKAVKKPRKKHIKRTAQKVAKKAARKAASAVHETRSLPKKRPGINDASRRNRNLKRRVGTFHAKVYVLDGHSEEYKRAKFALENFRRVSLSGLSIEEMEAHFNPKAVR